MTLPWERSSLADVWRWPQLFWLQFFGQWDDGPGGALRLGCMKMIRAMNALFLPLNIGSLTVGLGQFFERGELDVMTIYCWQASFIVFVILVELTRHKGKMKNAMQLLDDMMRHAVPKIDASLDVKIRTQYRRCWRLNCVLFTHGVLTEFSIVAPVLLWLCLGQKVTLTTTWPLNLNDSLQFSIALLFQAYISSIGTVLLFVYGSLYFSICENILIHLSILNDFFLISGSIEGRRERNDWMRTCINRHMKILKVCHLLRDSSKLIILTISTLTSICLCAFLQAIMHGSLPLPIWLIIIGSGFLFAYLMYFYCWFSTEVVHESQNIATSVYQIHWADWTSEEKKAIVIIAAVAQKPLIFGGIVQINLGTFITMFRATFAYYNFLDAVN